MKLIIKNEEEASFSFFMPPIRGYNDEITKQYVGATLVPKQTINLQQLVQMITTSERLRQLTEQVRTAADLSAAKQHLLPYFTPFGTCSQRRSDFFLESSHAIVLDIDHLESEAEARQLRDEIFRDIHLHPMLCFVSPSGKGVKILVPIHLHPVKDVKGQIAEYLHWAMCYLEARYERQVDASGKDLVRACFLSYDPEAKYRFP